VAHHGLGMVHRDLKPSNLFMAHANGSTTPYLLDFGLVKLLQSSGGAAGALLTESGDLLGTPQYMAPEQLGGERTVDHRADVWAMGVILYEALVGLRPFRGSSLGLTIKAVLSGLQNPVSELDLALPPGLAAMTDQMLISRREYRMSSLLPVRNLLRSLCGA
jgi:eukaryotic-like serine/threonine-protein kinase